MNTENKTNEVLEHQRTKITVYKGKGKTYVTKSGEIKHYDAVRKYTPKVKKFDPLLQNPEIQAILKDKTKKINIRTDEIWDIYSQNKELSKINFSFEQIKNFVYRNAQTSIFV